MGFWGGVRQGLETAQKNALDEEQMELAKAREERAAKVFSREEEEFKLDFLKKTRDLINPSAIGLPSMGSSKSKSGSSSNALTTKRMMTDLIGLGMKSEDIMKVMSNAGTPAASNRMLGKIHTRALEYNKGISSENYIEKTPTGEAMASLISDAIFSTPEEIILDDEWWKATEEQLDMTFSEEQRNDLYPSGKIIREGGLTFTRDLNLTEYASLPDTKAARAMIEDITVDIAAKVLGKIQTLQGDFNVKSQNNIALTDKEVKLKKYMDEQTTTLFDAIEAKDVNALGRLYGTEATSLLLKTNRGLVPGLLPPEYNKENQARIFFADRELLFLVMEAGLLNNGQIVSYYLRDDNKPNRNGELVTKVIGEE
tara:strand:- start:292 stop:1398 length:1107 start_codon:yes stop_codon:yes gene_type:complete